MPGLVPGIHVLLASRNEDVDGRAMTKQISKALNPPTVMINPTAVMPGQKREARLRADVPGIHVLLAAPSRTHP